MNIELSMQPLKLNQKFLTLVSLCAPADHVTRPEVLFNTCIGIYVFVTLCFDFVSSSFFVIQYKKRDLEDVLGSVLQIAAVSSNIYGMVSVFVASKRLRAIFSLFQTIYNDCNYDVWIRFVDQSCSVFINLSMSFFFFMSFRKGVRDESYRIFIKINQLCIKITKILVIKYVLGYYVLSVTLAVVNVTFCYIKDDGIDTKCLYTPYKHM